jgi:L-threonylcarbamoyladenylate synthase
VTTIFTSSPAVAAEVIRRGGTVAFPTETVYGLGADIFNVNAIEKIFAAKQRPSDNPLIAHVGSSAEIPPLAAHIPAYAQNLIDAFFPGPLTIVLMKTDRVPIIATGGLDTIGVRMPRHRLAHEFLVGCGVPLVAPSANVSGRPSPTTWQAVAEDLDGRIDCILQAEQTDIGLESTVVDCTGETPVVLRKGAISLEDLRAVVPATRESTAADVEKVRSPGLLYRHYSPKAQVTIVDRLDQIRASPSIAFIGLTKISGDFGYCLVCSSVEEYARTVFEFFRECDRRGIERIFCEAVPEDGIGAALMDRIRRAAEAD